MSISWVIYNTNELHPCPGMLLGEKKEDTAETRYRVEEPQKHAERKKLDAKEAGCKRSYMHCIILFMRNIQEQYV